MHFAIFPKVLILIRIIAFQMEHLVQLSFYLLDYFWIIISYFYHFQFYFGGYI